MRHKIEDECDYLVAEAQKVTDQARKILDEAKEANDYYREKLAAKLVAFCEAEEKYFSHYIELKLYYPDLAKTIESHRSHLREIMNQATTDHEQLKS
ncbi:MAG: hypothetical protein U9M92_02490 [Patescibacteria group bacterium]|nr:hypothetical protein [Patescibacteria group bacterium]